MKKVLISLALIFMTGASFAIAKPVSFRSPDGKLEFRIENDGQISYSLLREGVMLLENCPVSMILADNQSFDGKERCRSTKKSSVDKTLPTVIYKRAQVRENYNQLIMEWRDYDVIFRLYDDGAAYRFVSKLEGDYIVKDEPVSFNFAGDWQGWIPYSTKEGDYEKQFDCSYQAVYDKIALSQWKDGKIALLPFLVEGPKGIRICITEADLFSYPSMFVENPDKNSSVTSVFQRYPIGFQMSKSLLKQNISEYAGFIAKVNGPKEFPWRVIAVTDNDASMADNDLVYKLSTPADTTRDWSWVKPGKVAWDWWNDWNLYGVDFRAGINNDTYKYYIDFASANKIEYVILDEGWSVPGRGDLLSVIPEIDIKELVDYGASRGVGIILWAGYAAFDRNMEEVCKHYAAMGVKGFKVDFMNRSDQKIVDFYQRSCETAAKYNLLVDFHGAFKPTGLYRTWPNAINFEGIYGLEENKFKPRSAAQDQVQYDVTAPFIRFVAGPADYTQGAMHNVKKKNFYTCYSEPMSMGTRCHQLAEYVIFYSPVNMLCDSPSNYQREQECTSFIASVPTVWDETVALSGRIGEYVAIARRSGNDWYVAALGDWSARDLTLDLSFISGEALQMEIFRDGINADRAARDYKREVMPFPDSRQIKLHLAPGGGWIARISGSASDKGGE